VISIDPGWPFKGDDLLLTMEHEYGHALGLEHRAGYSIMKPGWEPPVAPGPTDEDFRDLQRLRSRNLSSKTASRAGER
jgi:predicted Zn-dependent protease